MSSGAARPTRRTAATGSAQTRIWSSSLCSTSYCLSDAASAAKEKNVFGIGVDADQGYLGSHVITSALKKVDEGRRSSEYLQDEIEKDRDRLERWEKVCADLGERPSDVALAWLLHQPAVTAPIIGPRTEEQLESSFRALEVQLDREVLDALDEIFPGPGGPAPEAYAW